MELNSPKTTTISGEVVSISKEISRNKKGEDCKPFRLITIDRWNDTPSVTYGMSAKNYDAQSNIIHKDAFVELTLEIRVADVTEYVDAQGEVQKHTSTGEGITKAVGMSQARLKMKYQAGLAQRA